MWIMLHTPPKLCRGDRDEWDARQRYIFERSYRRYQQTDDGKRVAEMAPKVLSQGSLGRIEGFRMKSFERVKPL